MRAKVAPAAAGLLGRWHSAREGTRLLIRSLPPALLLVSAVLLRPASPISEASSGWMPSTIAATAATMLFLGALAVWLSERFSHSRLAKFVDVMRGVAHSGDYSRRFGGVETNLPDGMVDRRQSQRPLAVPQEFDELIDAFNEMLTQVQARDEALRHQIREGDDAERTLQENEEQQKQAQKLDALGRLAGAVAHDFNNLLTIITGYSDITLTKMATQDPLRVKIGEIKKASARAADLTQQLLAFSRKQVLNPQVFNLNDIVASAEEKLRAALDEKIVLKTELSPFPMPIEADRAQVEQMILHLASNALDAMPDGGTLQLITHGQRDDPTMVCLEVLDAGTGMEREVRERIFEPFFTTKEKGKGTGLGLSMVYGVVTQSRGRISIDSAPGQGTAFHIHFPRTSPQDKVQENADEVTESSRGAETLLLVEDEEQLRFLARTVLLRQGYRVLEACHGQEAVDCSRRHAGRIDLMVTDIVMPHLNGHEAYERIAGIRPDMKVLFMSGYPDHALVREDGTVDPEIAYLQKPFSFEEFTQKVRDVLDADPPQGSSAAIG